MSANQKQSHPTPNVQIRLNSNTNGSSSKKKAGTIIVKISAQEAKNFIASGDTHGKKLKMKLPLKLKLTTDPNDPHSIFTGKLVLPDQEHIGVLTSQNGKKSEPKSGVQYKTEQSNIPDINSLAVQVSQSGHPNTLISIEETSDLFLELSTPQDHFDSPYTSVCDFFSSIAEQLVSKPVYSTLLDSSLIEEMFCQRMRMHFNFEQTQQLISIVLQYLALSKNHAQGRQPKHPLLPTKLQLRDFAEVMGIQWKKVKQEAYSLNRNILKMLDYIQPKCEGEGSRYTHCFFNLRFDLSDQQLGRVAQAVKYQCRFNHKSFCFLTNYLLKSCKQLEKSTHACIRQIQDILTSAINKLIQYHPPSSSMEGSEELLQRHPSFQLEKSQYPCKTLPLRNIPKDKKIQVLQRFIQYRARDAQKNSGAFARLIKDVCSHQGSNLSTGVKIKSMRKRRAIERVKQKVLDSISLSHRNQLLLDVNPNLSIDQYTQAEFEQYKHRLNAIFISLEQTIQFGVDDLLRGRCIFPSLDLLNNCCQQLKKEIPLRGYTLLSLTNRLKQKSSDIILNIRMGETVAELQLVLEYKLVQNEFSAKLQHLRRALHYNHITHLKLVNQKSTYLFLQEALTYIRDNLKPCSGKDYNEKTTYRQTKLNLDRFISILPFKFDRKEIDLNQVQLPMLAAEIDQFRKIVQTPTNELVSSRDILKNNGDFLYQLTKYQQSLKNQTQYCRSIEQKHRELIDHPQKKTLSQQERLILKSYAGAIYVIGKIHMRNKNYSSAVQYLQRSQKLTQILGNRDEYVIQTLQHLGQIQYRRNNLPKAVEIYTGLLKFQESSTKSTGKQYRQSLLALALVYQHQGNYFEAIRHLQRIIPILHKQKGKDHIELSNIYNYIGATYHLQGNLSSSLAAYRKSLAIIQREKGKNTLDCASVLANIGLIYEIDGNFYEAAIHYQRSMQICNKHNIKESIYANAAFGLGKCHAQNQNLSKAIDTLHKALQHFEKSKGQMYYATLTEIALAYQGLGEDEKASQYYDKLQGQ